MPFAYISVGSNIEPEKNVKEAVGLLHAAIPVLAISTVYLTKPIGRAVQAPYYNCVVKIQTLIQPHELKRDVLRRIEQRLGRTRGADKFAPRTIDLDLILYDSVVLHNDDLVLPDPDIRERPFLAAALHELDPDLILPGTEIRIADTVKDKHAGSMKPLVEYTNMLREELRNGH